MSFRRKPKMNNTEFVLTSDPMADYGWRCEQILGLNQGNPLQEHFFSDPSGIISDKVQASTLDNQEQNTYNKSVDSFIWKQNSLREKEIALKRLFFQTKPIIKYHRKRYGKNHRVDFARANWQR